MRVSIRPRDRDRAGLSVVRENQSRRDLTKVAQYDVLGNDARRRVRPARDDRNARLWSHAIPRAQAAIDRPVRDGLPLKTANPALRTGLLSLSPSGTKVLTGGRTKSGARPYPYSAS